MRSRAGLFLIAVAVAVAAAAGSALGATPSAGTVSTATPSATWTGGPFLGVQPVRRVPRCSRPGVRQVQPDHRTTGHRQLHGRDHDHAVGGGRRLRPVRLLAEREQPSAARPRRPATSGSCSRTRRPARTRCRCSRGSRRPGGTYSGKATWPSRDRPADPTSVKWTYDTSAPQASVEVPLRVVLVGFAPGELDTAQLLAEIPNMQRPGVLIPRGTSPSARRGAVPPRHVDADQPRARLLRRHEAVPRALRVPLEAEGRVRAVRLHVGPVRGDACEQHHRRLLEAAEPRLPRGLQRDARHVPRLGNTVAAERPVRFVDGEKTEDWIAANSKQSSAGTTRHAARGRAEPRLHGVRPQHVGLGRGAGSDPSRPTSTTSSRSTASTRTRATSTASTGRASGAAATAS